MQHRKPTRRTSPRLRERAVALRVAATFSESALWCALRAGQLGVRFRRQVPLLGRFIVDFYAPAVRLIVEVDGKYHARRPRADARRDRALVRAGYRVLRVPSELVIDNPAEAIWRVRAALAQPP